MNNLVIFTSLLILGACGATVSNTDKPTGAYLGGVEAVANTPSVRIVETSPPNTGQTITGVACKNRLWETEPTRETAIAVLKRETAKAGFNTVRITSVEENPLTDMKRNCWSTVIATGIGFTT